jgi:hypothetical protein
MNASAPKPPAPPTGKELVGVITVSVLFAEAAGGTRQFTADELHLAIAAVIKAKKQLGLLAKKYSPGRKNPCLFNNTFTEVYITPPPEPMTEPTDTQNDPAKQSQETADLQDKWLPAVVTAQLQAVGAKLDTTAGAPDPVAQYCNALLGIPASPIMFMPRRAIVLLITKFPAGWMAYSSAIAGNSAVFQYDWLLSTTNFKATGAKGWGADNLDRVVEHEMGHLFGGMDEYGTCDIGAASGPDNGANTNCINLATGGSNTHSVDCLMKNDVRNTLCRYTPSHFGWLDDDKDGIIDAARPQPKSLSAMAGKAGDKILVTGQFLGDTVWVTFVGVGPAGFTLKTDTTLEVTVPSANGPATPATVDVVVRTQLAESLKSAAMKFTYNS